MWEVVVSAFKCMLVEAERLSNTIRRNQNKLLELESKIIDYTIKEHNIKQGEFFYLEKGSKDPSGSNGPRKLDTLKLERGRLQVIYRLKNYTHRTGRCSISTFLENRDGSTYEH